MDRQREHGVTQWGDSRRLAGQRSQEHEESLGLGDPLGFGRVEPVEPGEVADAPGVQGEDSGGEVDAMNFGLLEFGPAAVFALGPDADAGTGPGPAGAAGALVGGCTTDAGGFPAVDAAGTVVTDCAGQAAVDNSGHALDRERGFGDVRAQDDFPAVAGGAQRAILFFGRQRAVERKHDGPGVGRGRSRRLASRRISANPGRKTSRWPDIGSGRQLFLDEWSDLLGVGRAGDGAVLQRNGVNPARDADDRAAIKIIRDLVRRRESPT